MASRSLWPCSSTPNTTSSAVLSRSVPSLQIHAIRVQVDVPAAQRAFLPGLILLLPVCLQLQDAARRQSRSLADQGAEDWLEVTTCQPLEVQPHHEARLSPRATLVARDDLGVEPVWADRWWHIADPRETDLDSTHADANGSFRQVAIAIASAVVGALIAAATPGNRQPPLRARPGASCELPREPASPAHRP